MKIKIKLKTYQCKVCQKPFANRQNVSRHRKLNPPCRDKPSDKPVIKYTCIYAKRFDTFHATLPTFIA